MKATELMVGDYVSVKPSGMLIKVAAVHKKKVAYHSCVSRFDWVRESLLEPIPITKEILEKNGFTNANYTPDSHSKKRYSTLADSRGYWVEICIESYFEGEVKYVHELQHILRLCEREKEIEL